MGGVTPKSKDGKAMKPLLRKIFFWDEPAQGE